MDGFSKAFPTSQVAGLLTGVLLLVLANQAGASPRPEPARISESLSLSGNGHVVVSHHSELNPTWALTVEAWVRRREDSRCETVVAKGFQSAWWLGFCSQRIRFYARGGQSGSMQDGVTLIPANVWTHIAVVYVQGSPRQYFINGELDYTGSTAEAAMTTNSLPLFIGQDPGDPSYALNGQVSQVRIWNVPRTQDEIRRYMHQAIDEPLPGLVANWRLAGVNFGEYADNVGGFNGTPAGTTSFTTVDGVPAQPRTVPFEYDFATMPWARHLQANIYLPDSDQLVMFGGLRGTGTTTTVIDRVDGVTGEVTAAIGNLPHALAFMAAAWAPERGEIYLFGGHTTNSVTGPGVVHIQAWNPDTGLARLLSTQLPEPLHSMSALYSPAHQRIFLFGGRSGANGRTSIYAFDPETETLSAPLGLALPEARSQMGSLVSRLNGRIYLVGGARDPEFGGESDQVWRVDLNEEGSGGQIVTLDDSLPGIDSSIEAVEDPRSGLVYLFGGSRARRVALLDPATDQIWSTRMTRGPFPLGSGALISPSARHALLIGDSQTISRLRLGDGPAVPMGDWRFPAPVSSAATDIDGSGQGVVIGSASHGAYRFRSDLAGRTVYTPANLGSTSGWVRSVRYDAVNDRVWLATHDAGGRLRGADSQNFNSDLLGTSQIRAVDIRPNHSQVAGAPFFGTHLNGLRWQRFDIGSNLWQWQTSFGSPTVQAALHRAPGDLWALVNGQLGRLSYTTVSSSTSLHGLPCGLLSSVDMTFGANRDWWVVGAGETGGGICRIPAATTPGTGTLVATAIGKDASRVDVDLDGRIWAALRADALNSGGVSVFEVSGGSTSAIRTQDYNWFNAPIGSRTPIYDTPTRRLWDSSVSAVGGVDESIWIGKPDGRLVTHTPRWGRIDDANELKFYAVERIWLAGGRAFFGGPAGFHILEPDGVTWTSNFDFTLGAVLRSQQTGKIWLGTSAGVRTYGPWGYDDLTDRVGERPVGQVRALAEDHNGRIWIGSDQGLTLFDRGRFVFTLNVANSDLPGNQIRALLVDRGNRLWVATNAGLARLDENRFRVYTAADGLLSGTLESLVELGTGEIIIGTSSPTRIMQLVENSFSTIPVPYPAARQPLSVDADGRLWAGRAVRIDGQWRIHHTTNTGLSRQAITDVVSDGAEQVWFAHGTAGGVSIRGNYLPPLANVVPTVTGVSSLVGSSGDDIIVHGTGLGWNRDTVEVFVGRGQAHVMSVTQTQLRIRLTPEVTSGPITVQVAGRRVSWSQNFCAVPVIDHFTPTGANDGMEVVVQGTNFDPSVQVSAGGPERPASPAATELRLRVDTHFGQGPIQVRNVAHGCNQVAVSDKSFRRFELSVDRITLNQGIPSIGLAVNKPTLGQVFLASNLPFRTGEGFDDRLEIDHIELELNQGGGAPQRVSRRYAGPVPIMAPGASEAWYLDIVNSVNVSFTPLDHRLPGSHDPAMPLTVNASLSKGPQTVAEGARDFTLRPDEAINVLLVPIMNNSWTPAQLEAMKADVVGGLEDARLRSFGFGRLRFFWSPMVYRANDILPGFNDDIDVGDSFELLMASYRLDRARRHWNEHRDDKIMIAYGVVERAINSNSTVAGMAYLPDTLRLFNALGLGALDALCEISDGLLSILTLGLISGPSCDIELPLYTAWSQSTGNSSHLFAHEIAHALGLVGTGQANHDEDNQHHSRFDEVADGTCSDVFNAGATYDANRTIYRAGAVTSPVVNPLTGQQFRPLLGEETTVEFEDGSTLTSGALTTRAKSIISYACGRENRQVFFEPSDQMHFGVRLDPSLGVGRAVGTSSTLRQTSRAFARARQAPAGVRLFVSGEVNSVHGTGRIDTVEPLGESAPLDASYETGYRLVQRDASGNELASIGLFPAFRTIDHDSHGKRGPAQSFYPAARDPLGGAHQDDIGFFSTTVVLAPGAARIDLRHGSQTLDSFNAGPGTPVISLSSPSGGHYASGNLPVSWTASDPDGDPLEVTVLYSVDNGVEWTPMAFAEGSASINLPVAVLAGSSQARIQVVASDGFRRASVISPPFSVAPRPPRAFIAAPEPEAAYLEWQAVRLAGGAIDVSDETVAADGLAWYSNRDGYLGEGPEIHPVLSVGLHQIMLLATNSHGLTSEAEIEVLIRGDYDADGVADDDELAAGLNPLWSLDSRIDYDGDGLPWIMEREWGTDPFNPDSSGSGSSDAEDILAGLDPLDPDDSLPVDQLGTYPPSLTLYYDRALGTVLPRQGLQLLSRNMTSWSVSADVAWIQTDASFGFTPQSLQVSARADLLPEGQYQGTLLFQSPLGNRSVPVTLIVVNADPELLDPIFRDRFRAQLETLNRPLMLPVRVTQPQAKHQQYQSHGQGRQMHSPAQQRLQLQQGTPSADDQRQSRTSGMSCPYFLMYSLCSARFSLSCCFRAMPLAPVCGTRSMTSMTRWKRSMSLSTVMSKGVVIVPSSL